MNISLEPGMYVVAVSGGVDSMALLHMLVQLAKSYPEASHLDAVQGSNEKRANRTKEYVERGSQAADAAMRQEPASVTGSAGQQGKAVRGLRLIVAHFDHGIREDSKLDKQLVKQVAETYNLPFVYDSGNLSRGASEATARKARYRFLRHLRDVSHARAIITAHHQDDALETALINWLRGTGRRGYTALKSDHELVRPLLDMPKQELINYARLHKLEWREDSTNHDTKYLRNLIRHKVMPQLTAKQRADMVAALQDLRGLNDQIDQKLVHFLHTQPKKQHIDRHWFTMLPHDVALEVMAMWLRLNGCEFDSKLLERLVAGAKTLTPGKKLDIDGHYTIEVGVRILALRARER